LSEARIPFDALLVREADFFGKHVAPAVDDILSLGNPPTAIFATNNFIAFSLVSKLAGRGKRVPEDIELACFDDIPWFWQLHPFVAIARQPSYDFGYQAAKLLLERIEKPGMTRKRRIVLGVEMSFQRADGDITSRQVLNVHGGVPGK
jgi:LacI family transcriptional regulator